jgi:hypothetical protein
MILRRVTEHIKAQNWFAVGLDFVIVVVGVFIGIQVSNWNESRVERLEEQAILVRLVEDYRELIDGGGAYLARGMAKGSACAGNSRRRSEKLMILRGIA